KIADTIFSWLIKTVLFIKLITSINDLEEVRRWKLLVITNDDDLLGAREQSKRIPWRNLTCLIDYKQIKGNSTGRKKLCNRQGTHKKDRLQLLNGGPRVSHKPTYGSMATLLIYFRSDDTHCSDMTVRPFRKIICEYFLANSPYSSLIEITKFEDAFV